MCIDFKLRQAITISDIVQVLLRGKKWSSEYACAVCGYHVLNFVWWLSELQILRAVSATRGIFFQCFCGSHR